MTDNVRKVFNLLGVEPNEKFRVDGLGECYIDSNLDIYLDIYLHTGGIKLKSNLIIDIIKGEDTIIKLPQEQKKKKKKLRDITEEEWNKWKDKNCSSGNCNKCFFDKVNCFGTYSNRSWFYNKDLFSNRFLDQEIEVEE